MHRDEDPRARALLELTADLGVAGHRLSALAMLTDAIASVRVQPPSINAAGANAAALGEAGIQANQFGPFAVTARAAVLATRIATTKRPPTDIQPVTEAHGVVAR